MRTKRPGESALLLLDAVAVLLAEDIEYAVIGAMAASVHGVIRASLDADAIMSLATQKLRDLQKRFIAADFETELRYDTAKRVFFVHGEGHSRQDNPARDQQGSAVSNLTTQE